MSINVRAFKDGVVGWVTVAGSAPGGSIFRVLQPTYLTLELRDLEGTSAIKALREGDILEVLGWARTSRSTLGVTRVMVRCHPCGSIGWATIAGNDGALYLAAA